MFTKTVHLHEKLDLTERVVASLQAECGFEWTCDYLKDGCESEASQATIVTDGDGDIIDLDQYVRGYPIDERKYRRNCKSSDRTKCIFETVDRGMYHLQG